jgi:hypothetical protein
MSMGNHPYTSRPLWFPGQSRRLVQWPVAGSVPKSASGFKLTPTGKHGRIAIELLEASSGDTSSVTTPASTGSALADHDEPVGLVESSWTSALSFR